MIRFGKFSQRSMVGFDAEMRREMGNKTHEAGVSCFKSILYKGGYLITEHEGRSSWTVGFDLNRLLLPWATDLYPQYVKWKDKKIPMDVFVIRGHLVSHGLNNEWLDVGSDGEYLIDINKPHTVEHVSPDKLWISHNITLQAWYDQHAESLDRHHREV